MKGLKKFNDNLESHENTLFSSYTENILLVWIGNLEVKTMLDIKFEAIYTKINKV